VPSFLPTRRSSDLFIFIVGCIGNMGDLDGRIVQVQGFRFSSREDGNEFKVSCLPDGCHCAFSEIAVPDDADSDFRFHVLISHYLKLIILGECPKLHCSKLLEISGFYIITLVECRDKRWVPLFQYGWKQVGLHFISSSRKSYSTVWLKGLLSKSSDHLEVIIKFGMLVQFVMQADRQFK